MSYDFGRSSFLLSNIFIIQIMLETDIVMIILKVLLCITALVMFLYFIWNIGEASGLIRCGEFGPDTLHSGLAAFISLLIFIITLGAILCLFDINCLIVFKIASFVLTALWGCACLISSVKIWLDIKHCYIYYILLLLCLGLTIAFFKL